MSGGGGERLQQRSRLPGLPVIYPDEESRGCRGHWAPHPTLLTQLFPQVHHIKANDFLDITSMKPEDIENHVFSFSSTFEDPSTATYMQFLKEGLRRGLPLLQP